ncbi:MAG: DUF2249 domain-containing protein [Brumimicrobium sp.]|nr:DUF2249 domain-containing protein [Brumimicrobium sp.]
MGYKINEEHDVRDLVPRERHIKLIEIFRNTPINEGFTFINDHDPLPLFYEFRSIFGDVVDWEYITKGGRDWKVQVARTNASAELENKEVSTTIDLRKVEEGDWKHVVFHRYGMMNDGEVMELLAAEDPKEIHGIFVQKFEGKHIWIYKSTQEGEYIIHIGKKGVVEVDEEYSVVNEFDVRPFPPYQRHEMFYDAFAALKPGEAFVFTNDHDPSPLYYQMKAESKEEFKWEYLEKGPEAWRVRVIKTK